MDDDTKADAPLTPDEERALREAWAHIGSWEPWDGQEPGATYECPLCNGEGETEGVILDATKPFAATLGAYGIGPGLAAAELVAGSTGRLLTTLDEVRFERDAVQALHEDARELLAATRAELDAAWQATGVASTVRGLTTLADVVTTQRESAAELRRERDAARARVELLRQRLLSSDRPLVDRLVMLAALGGDQ